MQVNRATVLKRIIIFCGIAIGIVSAIILIPSAFISSNLVRQKITQIAKDRSESIHEVGPLSFHWPNRIHITYLILQKENQHVDTPVRFDDIQATVKLFPLILKKFVAKKIFIRQINYENRFLIKDFVTDEFSYENDTITTCAHCYLNEGPASVKGTINFHQKKPVFDLSIEGKDIYITQDVPALNLLPIFTGKEGEIGGILSLSGRVQGKGMGKDVLNKKLTADINIHIRDGYIRGNKLVSSILEIVGAKDSYSFDSLNTMIQINEGKIYTPNMDARGPLLDLNASGTVELEGTISYDVVVKFHKEHLSKDIEKIARFVLNENELPVEIRGTTKDPKVSVKLPKNSLEHIIQGLANDFLHSSKKKK
jgi:uncharacterized protein involved in outer membrane biogenesis